jgi:quercetin dioxygenase-like cupin family protein/DNA-binding beta-propeller fold protein YncE
MQRRAAANARPAERSFPMFDRRPQPPRSLVRHAGPCLLIALLASVAAPAPAAPAPSPAPASSAAQAAPPASPGITRQLLDERPVEGTPGLKTQLWRIEYPPGASAPSHHHPVVGIGYVVEGAFDSAFAGAAPTHVTAGQSFVDPARVEHRLFRNASSQKALTFLVAYTIPEGTPILELTAAERVQLKAAASPLPIAQPALYPETIDVNPLTQKFLVSSLREGAVYQVGLDGKAELFLQDERLTSILGIAVDTRSKRLLVTNSDLGAAIRRSTKGPKQQAGVGIYDLASRKSLHYVDLAPVLPRGDHLINGITVDEQGNAYATDSLSPAIYKVNPEGKASLFLEDAEFRGPGINLNGIVSHPQGFLIAVKKSTGALYRIVLAEPERFTRIQTPRDFVGGDGLSLVGQTQLVLVANETPAASSDAAFVLESQDGWKSARVLETRPLGPTYPTTGVALGGKYYLLSSHLDEWLGASPEARDALVQRGRRAEILELGNVAR